MCTEFIRESEIEEIYTPGHYENVSKHRPIFGSKYVPASIKTAFKPDTPMKKFEGKMSRETRAVLLDITLKQYVQLVHPEFTKEEIYYIAGRGDRGFAYAVEAAKVVIKMREEKTIKPEVVAESALRGGTTTEDVTRAASAERTGPTPEKDSKAPDEEEMEDD